MIMCFATYNKELILYQIPVEYKTMQSTWQTIKWSYHIVLNQSNQHTSSSFLSLSPLNSLFFSANISSSLLRSSLHCNKKLRNPTLQVLTMAVLICFTNFFSSQKNRNFYWLVTCHIMQQKVSTAVCHIKLIVW